jgi:hypothetical protein
MPQRCNKSKSFGSITVISIEGFVFLAANNAAKPDVPKPIITNLMSPQTDLKLRGYKKFSETESFKYDLALYRDKP